MTSTYKFSPCFLDSAREEEDVIRPSKRNRATRISSDSDYDPNQDKNAPGHLKETTPATRKQKVRKSRDVTKDELIEAAKTAKENPFVPQATISTTVKDLQELTPQQIAENPLSKYF